MNALGNPEMAAKNVAEGLDRVFTGDRKMPHVPKDEIERLKTEVSLQRLVESAGMALKKHGKDWRGLCPFHDDHEPSLVVSPDKNLWNCLGRCQQGGDVIAWVMKRAKYQNIAKI